MLHTLDVVAALILLFSFVRGFQRGAGLALLDIVRTVCAYWAAWRFARPMGDWLAHRVDMGAVAATVVGGVVVFAAVSVSFALLESRVRGSKRRRQKASSPSGRPLGAFVGIITGIISIVALCWLYGAARTSPWGSKLPPAEGSRAVRLSRQVVERGAYLALKGKVSSPNQARRLAAMVSDPEGSTLRLRSVAQSPKLTRLVGDSAFGHAVRSGERSAIMGNPRLRALLSDEPTMTQLARLGMVPESWRTAEYRATLAEELARIGPRIDAVLEDSLVQRAVAGLQDEGLFAPEKLPVLLTDGRFLAVVEKVMAEKGSSSDTLETP